MTVRDLLDNEPLRTLVGLLQQMAEHVAVHTGYKGITRLSLSHEFGPLVGIMPGTSVDVMTAAGRVEIYCESAPRAVDVFTISDDSGGIEARVGAYANMITEGPACCIPAPPDGWPDGFWRNEAHDTEEGK